MADSGTRDAHTAGGGFFFFMTVVNKNIYFFLFSNMHGVSFSSAGVLYTSAGPPTPTPNFGKNRFIFITVCFSPSSGIPSTLRGRQHSA